MRSRQAKSIIRVPYRFERLESRILLSADPIVAGLSVLAPEADNDATYQRELPPFELKTPDISPVSSTLELSDVSLIFDQQTETATSVLFVDSNVDDVKTLLNGIANDVDIVFLNAEQDGILQISEYFSKYDNITDMHIASHGTGDGFWLGDTFVTENTLAERASDIASWAGSLTDGADIFLYGCDLASTINGQSLLTELANLTDADIAASNDLTGHATLGGDWNLEFATGQIDAGVLISNVAQANWTQTLGQITLTTGADQLDGDADTSSLAALALNPGADGLISLREAVEAANANADADIIFLGADTYVLTRTGIGDNTGDFDIRADLSFVGAGPENTIIFGNNFVRNFEIHDDTDITVTFSNLKLENGSTNLIGGRDGGAIKINSSANTATVDMNNVWFFDNQTDLSGGSGKGGAIYNEGVLSITNSLFENNSSRSDGAAIYNAAGATLNLVNTTISGNFSSTGNGAGINNAGTATINNSTIALNTANGDGGGIFNAGTLSLGNSIVAGNTAAGNGPDIDNGITSLGNNIISNDSNASGFLGSDQLNVDPLLGLLMDNGGDLKTHAPGATSTAIDNAGTLAPAVDQRGLLRDANPDIGAFEVNATSAPANATLWFSTDNAVSGGGQQGISTWDKADVLSFDNPNLHLGPGTTSGSVGLEIDFPSGARALEGLHFVSKTVNIAGGAFQLLRGDVLFNSRDNSAVFTSNNAVALLPGFSATVNADRDDIVVFRPDVAGDYSAGQFGFLLDNVTGANVLAFTLVEQAMTVGGTSLAEGDFLYVRSGGAEDNSISIFSPTAVGELSTTGSNTLFLDGADTNVAVAAQIHGLELIEETINVGDRTLNAGQLLVTLDNADTVGANALSVTGNDIFILDINQSTENGGAGNGDVTASSFFSGNHAGFDSNDERFNSLALAVTDTPPIADETAGAPHTITAGGTISFDGSNSSDPDGTITTYEWDINNDGSFEKTGVTVSYDWSELNAAGVNTDGTFDVALRVTDNDANVSSTTFSLTVNNATPTFSSFSNAVETTNEDTQVEITFAELAAEGDQTDVGGSVDAFIVQAVSSGTLLIGADVGSATAFASGTNDVIGTGLNAYWTPANDQNGTLNAFTVRARDDDGAVSSTSVTAQVDVTDVNDAPTFSSFVSTLATTNEETEVEITFGDLATQGNEMDVDGTVDAFEVKAVSSGTLRIGADAGSATAFATGANDTVTVGLNAYWTPGSDQSGTLNAFTVEAQDDDGALSGTPIVAQVNVTNVNDAPTLSGAPFALGTIDEDTTSPGFNVGTILAGFTTNDADGNTLGLAIQTVTANATWQFSSDSTNGTDGTWADFPTVNPNNALLLSNTSWVRYVPDGTNPENPSLLFSAWDGTTGTASSAGSPQQEDASPGGGQTAFSTGNGIANLTVTDINDIPTFTAFTSTIDSTNEDIQVEITFAELAAQGNEADVDGTVDSFVVQAVSSGTLLIGADAGSATAFAVGTNDEIGVGLNAYWTPANDQNGTLDAFTVEAKDNDGALSGTPVTAQVSVTAVNDAPTFTTFTTHVDSTNEDAQVEITFADLAAQGNEGDVDGTVDSFVVQAVSSGTLLIGADAGSASAFAVGTNDEIGVGLNAYWTPANNQNGALNAFTVEAKDNDGALSGTPVTAQVNVIDVNDDPTFTTFTTNIDATNEDTQVEITFAELAAQGNEADTDGTVDSFVVQAVSSGTLLIGANAGSATAFAVGTNDEIGVGLNAYWTPANNQNGTLNAFTVIAKDDDGGVSAAPITAQVNVSDVNDIPTLTTFTANIDSTNEDTQVEITFAELVTQGNEADVDGTVDSFIVQAVSSGTLLIGADAGSATAFAVGVNDEIGIGLNAYWTPANNQNGTLSAFTVVAKDDDGGESATPITAQVNIVDVNDAPTFTTFSSSVTTANASIEEAISFSDIHGVSNAADVDGTINAYVVKNVSDGILRIGTSAATATAWSLGVNDVIDGTNSAFWTPSALASGAVNAFGVVARDDDAAESVSIVQVQATVFSVNQMPTLDQNTLTINEGQSKTLTTGDLLANDLDDAPDELAISISNINNGQFERVASPGLAVTSFTQADINAGAIKFVHDGSENPPSYSITVSDGSLNTAIEPATILFSNVNDAPTLDLNQLTIEQDGKVTLTVGGNLNATDPDDIQGTLVYQASNIVGGQFERTTNPGIAVLSFSHGELRNGDIQFVHDGSATVPSYVLRVSDGEATSAPTTVEVSYTPSGDDFFGSEEQAAEAFASSQLANQAARQLGEDGSKDDSDTSDGKESDNSMLSEQALALQEISDAIEESRSEQANNTSRLEFNASNDTENARERRSSSESLKTLIKTQLNLGTATTEAILGPIDAALDMMISVVESNNFRNGLDSLREEIATESLMDQVQIGSSVAVSTGLSIGYVVWLIRGGVLVSSMLSALPAWRFIDPLPILAFGGSDDDEDQESLESLVNTNEPGLEDVEKEAQPSSQTTDAEIK